MIRFLLIVINVEISFIFYIGIIADGGGSFSNICNHTFNFDLSYISVFNDVSKNWAL